MIILKNESQPSKSKYKEYILTKITAFHEQELRREASKNDMMKYLNVSLIGLRGKIHPALKNVTTTHAVRKMRPHIKMLSGDYLTFEVKSLQSGGSPYCRMCDLKSEPESLEHLISRCSAISEIRTRISNSMNTICQDANIDINIKTFNDPQFTQFVLDPSSMNLRKRVNMNDPILPSLFQLSRDFCFSIDRNRTKSLT